MSRALVSSCLLSVVLLACGGGGGSTDGGTGGGGATGGGTGGGATGGGSGGGATGGGTGCTAAGTPNTVIADFQGYSLSVVGQDAYYVVQTENAGRGTVHHVALDGTGDTAIVTVPAMTVLLGATAVGPDLYYFEDDDSPNGTVHVYRTSRTAGGVGTQLGTGTFPGLTANITGGGVAGIEVSQTTGVFAARGTDLFINDGLELSRVSTVDGAKTVLASVSAGGLLFPTLVGDTVYFRDVSGALFSVAADATTASAAPLGTVTCGTGRTKWTAAYAGGFLCGEPFGVDHADLAATAKTHVIYTLMDPQPVSFNPSPVDGTTWYALPTGAGSAISRFDGASTSSTPVACGVGLVLDAKLTATDLVFVEAQNAGGNFTLSVKRLAR